MSREDQPITSILFVCMGNICRSPLAEGVMRQHLRELGLLERVVLDSAGTHGYHEGAAPDERAQAAAMRRGIDISDLRARLVVKEDFQRFDLILAMDEDNLDLLQKMAATELRSKARLLMDYAAGDAGRSVPDPYYGGPIGFERVLDMVEEATDGLLARLQAELRGP